MVQLSRISFSFISMVDGFTLGDIRKFKPENIVDNRDPDPNKWIISLNPEQGFGDSGESNGCSNRGTNSRSKHNN